jgi:hypothetical protein
MSFQATEHRDSAQIVLNAQTTKKAPERRLALFVVDLDIVSRPATIFRSVIAVIVNAIDGMLRGWFRTQIVQKQLEGMAPTRTDANPSLPIKAKGFVARILAARNQVAPRHVFSATARTMRAVAWDFTETATRFRVAAFEVVIGDSGRLIPARTAAAPILDFPVTAWDWRGGDNGQLSKDLSDKRRTLAHVTIIDNSEEM